MIEQIMKNALLLLEQGILATHMTRLLLPQNRGGGLEKLTRVKKRQGNSSENDTRLGPENAAGRGISYAG